MNQNKKTMKLSESEEKKSMILLQLENEGVEKLLKPLIREIDAKPDNECL